MFSSLSSATLILILISSSLIPTCYAAKIYHWVDNKGQPHFSENAPRDVQSDALNIRATVTSSANRTVTTDTSKTTLKSASIRDDEEERLTAKHSPADKAKYCQQSQGLLQQMNGNTQRRFEQPDGGFRRLDQAEISTYKAKAQAGIKNYCR
jgi:hypothetical protein